MKRIENLFNALEPLSSLNVSMNEIAILAFIGKKFLGKEDVILSSIYKHFSKLSPSTVFRVLKNLEKNQVIMIKKNAHDERKKNIVAGKNYGQYIDDLELRLT